MKYFYDKLIWKEFKTLVGDINFTELDKYADLTLDNGISIRVSTGQMAHATASLPYELNILYPNGNTERVERLSSSGLNHEINLLHEMTFN